MCIHINYEFHSFWKPFSKNTQTHTKINQFFVFSQAKTTHFYIAIHMSDICDDWLYVCVFRCKFDRIWFSCGVESNLALVYIFSPSIRINDFRLAKNERKKNNTHNTSDQRNWEEKIQKAISNWIKLKNRATNSMNQATTQATATLQPTNPTNRAEYKCTTNFFFRSVKNALYEFSLCVWSHAYI